MNFNPNQKSSDVSWLKLPGIWGIIHAFALFVCLQVVVSVCIRVLAGRGSHFDESGRYFFLAYQFFSQLPAQDEETLNYLKLSLVMAAAAMLETCWDSVSKKEKEVLCFVLSCFWTGCNSLCTWTFLGEIFKPT
jgi:hypothetical protein